MKTLSIFKAKVIEVIDGDTFRGEVNLGFDIRITRSFRVYGIDTPEIFRPKSDMERVKGVLARDKKIIGKKVSRGQRIGIAQDISKLYNTGVKKMLPHIHLQIETIDPTLLMI